MHHLPERSNLSWLSHWLESRENERGNDLDTRNILCDGLAVPRRGGGAECDRGLARQKGPAPAHPNPQKPSRPPAAGCGGGLGVAHCPITQQQSFHGPA